MKFIFETFIFLFTLLLLNGCALSPEIVVPPQEMECSMQGGSWKQDRCYTEAMLKVEFEERKESLIKQAEAGNTHAMNELGQIYFGGSHGTEQDYYKAFEYYSKSCAIDGSGCKMSEIISRNGYTVPAIKECSNGIAASCVNVGDFYRDKFDLTKAADFYGKACDLGDTHGCSVAKQFRQQNEQARLRDQLLKANNYEKAYQAGLIDKNTARAEMLKHYQILEAYDAGLIDKDTADLYLKKQAIDQQAKAARDQVSATNNAAFDAQMYNSPNLLNQQLQNMQNYNQMNQMINQQNINNNMRKYY